MAQVAMGFYLDILGMYMRILGYRDIQGLAEILIRVTGVVFRV